MGEEGTTSAVAGSAGAKGSSYVWGLQRAEEGPQDEHQEGAGISSLWVSLPAQVTAGPWVRESQCLVQQISLQ